MEKKQKWELKCHKNENITVNGERINKSKNKLVYLAFNKPKGIVCTTDSKVEKDNIIDFINYPKEGFFQ